MRRFYLALALAIFGCTDANPEYCGDGGCSDAGTQDAILDDMTPIDIKPETPPSCVGLPPTCGASGAGEPCCGSPLVVGGTFYRSHDVAADGVYPGMTHPATVSDFHLDRFEITVGRFRRFVSAGKGTQNDPPASGAGEGPMPGTGWDPAWNAGLAADTPALRTRLKCDANHQTWTDVVGANESLPINCVNWFEAFAFCIWDGGRLPTEAEWNYAASGGADQRTYPWSNPPGSTAISDGLAVYCGATCAIQIAGSRSPQGDGRWGQADLSGNAWEWVFDGYAPYVDPCIDCANAAPSANRALRGGNFAADPTITMTPLRTASRSSAPPLTRDNGSGVRCAR